MTRSPYGVTPPAASIGPGGIEIFYLASIWLVIMLLQSDRGELKWGHRATGPVAERGFNRTGGN